MRKLFWFVLVLAALAVAADRGADLVAERTLADRVRTSQDLRRTPEASIAGFPFLTQLYRGRFEHLTVTAHGVPVGADGQQVTLRTLTMDFRGVTADRRFRTFSARTGTATARIPYAEVGRVLDLEVSYAGNGAVEAVRTFTVAGQRLRPRVRLRPEVLDGALTFTSSTLEQGLPGPVAERLRQALDLEVPLTRLPFGIRPTSLSADRDGIVLRLSGKDLRYTR